jgi:cell shape-determining protein MreC
MAGNRMRVSNRVIFVWCSLAGLIFFFAPNDWTYKWRLGFNRFFRLPLSAGRSFSSALGSEQSGQECVPLAKYNRVRNELANLKHRLDQERQKVAKLSGLRDRDVWQGTVFVLADVITRSIDASQASLIVNRGERDGVVSGQFVLGDNSVIGTVTAADARTAQVTLFTDPAARTAVDIAEGAHFETGQDNGFVSDVPMIMRGAGADMAKIRLVHGEQKIPVGGVVFAIGKPGLLDTAMIAGTVHQCSRDPENPLLWEVSVKPVCEFDKLDEVTIVIMNPRTQ